MEGSYFIIEELLLCLHLKTRGDKMAIDLNLMVGGEAGQGIQTIGFVLGKALTRGGLHVFADQDYESRIRGGHNFFRVRASDQEIHCQDDKLDVLIALNRQTVDIHRQELKTNGLIVADTKALNIDIQEGVYFDIPLENLAVESSSNKIMSNSVAIGSIAGLLEYDFEILADVLRWQFAKNSEQIKEDNVKAAKAGFEYARKHVPKTFLVRCKPSQNNGRMFLNGCEAISLGAIAAGCKFLAAYPMTPTTPILEYLADKGRFHNIAVVQPEDEISAINMVIGASYTGVRSMTATSGSGFALMIEGIGLSGMTETPAVIVLGQRPGPAIGLPTRTEQGELLLAINTGTGEFPKAVFAPANIQDAFDLTTKAFNVADRFQIPVMILIDTHLAHSYKDCEKFDLKQVKIDRGELISDEVVDKIINYKRYQDTPSGISPRALPMQIRSLVVSDSDEHDETGHLTESAEIRIQQVNKRLRKYVGLKKQLAKPRFHETPEAEITLIGFGSTYGAILEASNKLLDSGLANNVLHISEIWPFPAEFVSTALKKTKQNIVIESNATGQLAYLIQAETGQKVTSRVNKWDGRSMSSKYILDELKKGVI
jgi:2-oxoglutarate/2-oxoacid ferredoxin oxidoreductase subunit alpha